MDYNIPIYFNEIIIKCKETLKIIFFKLIFTTSLDTSSEASITEAKKPKTKQKTAANEDCNRKTKNSRLQSKNQK